MIEIKKCSKSYEQKVLNDIDLHIAPNQFAVLKGASGSGKTTLLNIVAGILKCDSGIVSINNNDITKLNDSALSKFRNENISYIRQSQGLVHWLNIRDNLELPFYISPANFTVSEKEKKINEIIETFDLKNILKKYPEKISGGQYQRAAIASSIIKLPRIILADEPTNNLDKKNIGILLELFEKFKTRKTVVVVSHIDIFDRFADVIFNLENGIISNA